MAFWHPSKTKCDINPGKLIHIVYIRFESNVYPLLMTLSPTHVMRFTHYRRKTLRKEQTERLKPIVIVEPPPLSLRSHPVCVCVCHSLEALSEQMEGARAKEGDRQKKRRRGEERPAGLILLKPILFLFCQGALRLSKPLSLDPSHLLRGMAMSPHT